MFSVRLTRNIQRFQHWTRFKSSSSVKIDGIIDVNDKTNEDKPKAAAPKKVACEFD